CSEKRRSVSSESLYFGRAKLQDLELEADLIILPATLKVVVNASQSKVYGDEDPSLTYTILGFQNDDDHADLTGELTREPGEHAGLYAISKGNLDAGTNYTIDFVGGEFEIEPAKLWVQVDPGQGKMYGDTEPASFTFTATGFRWDDGVEVFSG